MAKKSAKSKGFRKQSVKKPYLTQRDITITCVVVALLAVAAFMLFRYDDGALKVRDGAVETGGDNWLIVDGSNVRGRARYFKLGEIGEIDGYTRQKGAQSTDANVPEYTFEPAGEDGAFITATCAHGGAAAMAKYALAMLSELSTTTDAGEVQSTEMAGQPVQYYIYASDSTARAEAEDAEGEAPAAAQEGEGPQYRRSAVGYVDASHDSCVVVKANSQGDSAEACLSDEALLDLLSQAVAAVSLDAPQ